MKKILLGCGLIVLLGLGFLGYVAWKISPEMKSVMQEAEQAARDMEELDRQYPFEPDLEALDPGRFDTYLGARVRTNIDEWTASLEATGQELEDQDTGWIQALKAALGKLQTMPATVVPVLQETRMSGSEFNWNARLLWATLETIDAGMVGSGTRLGELRGLYPELRGAYNAERQSDAPELDELIGDFPPLLLEQARNALAEDVDRVRAGIAKELEAEIVFLAVGHETFAPIDGASAEGGSTGDDGP